MSEAKCTLLPRKWKTPTSQRVAHEKRRNIVRLSSLQPYILTAVAIALSIPARLLLDPWLGDKLAFVTMFPVVVIAAWWAGPGPAVMATLLGTAGFAFFVLEPRSSFAIASPEYRIGVAVNAVVCLACTALIASLRRARSQAEATAWQAKLQQQQLEQAAAERSLVEATLRSSEEQFRALFDLSAVGQTLADPATLQLTRVNRKYCEITGYAAEELVAVVPGDHSSRRSHHNCEGYSRLLRGELSEFATQKRYIRKDGTIIWVQVNISLVPGGPNQPLRTAAIIQDITAGKQLELSLKESEGRFRGIFDQAAVGVGQTNLQRQIIDVNPGLCRILGYERHELVGLNIRDISHPDERATSAEAMRPLLAARPRASRWRGVIDTSRVITSGRKRLPR